MQTIEYWEIVCPDPGSCCGGDEVLGRFQEYSEAARALSDIREILRLRNGYDADRLMDVEIVPRMPVTFGSFVSPLVPGELFLKACREAAWRTKRMLDPDQFSFAFDYRGELREGYGFLYEDKRSRSLERIARIFRYAQVRLGPS